MTPVERAESDLMHARYVMADVWADPDSTWIMRRQACEGVKLAEARLTIAQTHAWRAANGRDGD